MIPSKWTACTAIATAIAKQVKRSSGLVILTAALLGSAEGRKAAGQLCWCYPKKTRRLEEQLAAVFPPYLIACHAILFHSVQLGHSAYTAFQVPSRRCENRVQSPSKIAG